MAHLKKKNFKMVNSRALQKFFLNGQAISCCKTSSSNIVYVMKLTTHYLIDNVHMQFGVCQGRIG